MPTTAKRARKQAIDYPALAADMELCRLALRKPRSERTEMVRQFVGSHWSEEGTARAVPVNLISLYVQIVGRSLIAKDPRVMLSTFEQSQRAVVEAEEEWLNQKIVDMRLAKTLGRVVTDALFSIGICKTGITTPAQAQQLGWEQQAGEPYIERVDLDDFVFDIHARDFSEVSFIGHRFRVPLDAIQNDPRYGKNRKKLTASTDEPFNQQGDERIGVLGRTYYASASREFIPHVDLWEVYLPQTRMVVTLPLNFETDEEHEPLLEQEWLGPDCGPYHILGYQLVPGNAMPKGPIQDLYDLHLFVNETYRKLMRQSARQKDLTFIQGGANEDGTRVLQANDGDMPKVDNPDKIVPASMGGPNQANFLFVQHAWELFSKQAGNLEMMGGLSPQSKTATQDKMLMANASGQVFSMQQDTANYVDDVLHSLSWYYHHHPTLQMKVKHQVPGVPELSMTRRVSPQQRQGVSYGDIKQRLDVYSMQQQTPQTRLQSIQQVLQMMQPLMPMAQQQGIYMDLNRLVAIFAKFLDCPELLEILQVQEPPQNQGETPTPSTGQPAETTRNYVRRSLGGESEQSQTADLMNTLAKGMGQNQTMPLNPNGAG